MEEKVKKIGTAVFYTALVLEMLFVLLDKSEYIIPYETWMFRLTFIMFCCKIACTKYTRKEMICIFLFGVLGVISFLVTDREEIIRVVAFAAAFKGIDIKTAAKLTFYETLIGSLVIVFLSITGIYGAVSVTGNFRGGGIEETRYCLGMGHPNAVHCMFFMILTLGLYIYNESCKWWHYGILFILNAGLFCLTDSRTGFLAGAGTVFLFALLRYVPVLEEKKTVYILGGLFLLFCIIFTIITGLYGEEVGIIKFFNRKVNGRLQIGLVEGGVRTWRLFSEKGREVYFDMGWMRLFYWYGIVPAIIYLAVIAGCIRQCFLKRNGKAFLMLMILTAYTVLEAHLISVYIGRNYMLFLIGAFWPEILEMTGEKEPAGEGKS